MLKINIRDNIKVEPILKDTINKNGSITIQFGCKNIVRYREDSSREKIKIFLQLQDFKVKEFSEDALQRLATTISLITGFILGPKTVVELYADPFMNDLLDIIINDTDDKIVIYEQPCLSDEQQIDHSFRQKNMYIRSIKLWNYNYYKHYKATRYCDNDSECFYGEYCLCPNRIQNGEWCPVQKKRCMPKAEFVEKSRRIMEDGDIIDSHCVESHMNNYKKKWGTPIIPFSELKDISTICSKKEYIDNNNQNLSLGYYLKSDNIKPQFHGDGYSATKEHFNLSNNNTLIDNLTKICIIFSLLMVLYEIHYMKNTNNTITIILLLSILGYFILLL